VFDLLWPPIPSLPAKALKPGVCPVLFLIFLQHHLWDHANKTRVFIREKNTDFVIPVFPHLWRTKRGVHQMVIRGINGSLRAPTPPLPPSLLGLHFHQQQCHTACKPTAAAAVIEGLQPWRFSCP
jgi:hypothetical protein